MCGIIAYHGKNQALPILLEGLKRLEYRGYDSSGLAIFSNNKISSIKELGKISNLEKKIVPENFSGNIGLAHTRWATHGEPTQANAHPHSDCKEKIYLVHNGIIENYKILKQELLKKGHFFKSDTDSEVIAHLLEEAYEGDIKIAVKKVLGMIRGAYGLVIMHIDEPDKLIVARQGSPLIIGLGQDEIIIASDVSAILRYTKQVIYLSDGEMAEVSQNDFKIFNYWAQEVSKNIEEIEWDLETIEKQGFDHFMLKEINEQAQTITNSLRGRMIIKNGHAKLGGLEEVKDKIGKINNLFIVACGTAYYSGLIGKYMLEEYAEIPVTVDFASEFRYRKFPWNKDSAVLALSQSGETADTLAAIKEAKSKNILSLGIVNAVGSSIARETDAGIYNHIGPEIAVASTKAFTSQLSILALITVFLGRQRNMSAVMGERILKELSLLPAKINEVLKESEKIRELAKKYQQSKNFLFLGRKYNYPLAMEGALKLKEISYIHAEGLSSGEMKHGHIAMIDENFPSLMIAPLDSVYEKNISNLEEIKARKGPIILISTVGNEEARSLTSDVIFIPKTLEMLTPILAVIPLQLFAYHMAVLNNKNVDKPRNLAKSVTVE